MAESELAHNGSAKFCWVAVSGVGLVGIALLLACGGLGWASIAAVLVQFACTAGLGWWAANRHRALLDQSITVAISGVRTECEAANARAQRSCRSGPDK